MEVQKESEATDSSMQEEEGSPHEALFLVLCYYLPLYELLVMTQVCRSLREALGNDILPWLNIVVGKPLNKRLNDDHLLNVTSKAQGRVKFLALYNCSKITEDGLHKVIERNPLISQHSSPGIDVDICPKCNEARVVFDCPRDSCKKMRQQQKVECRGCQFCIPRCEECGRCIKEEDPFEVACADKLCLDCWLQLSKCSFCNKPYCSQHADQQQSLSDSSGWVCTDCHARLTHSPKDH